MRDFVLNGDHDLDFDGKDFFPLPERTAAAVAQRIKIRLLTIFREYKWDYGIGVDWFGTVFNTEKTYVQKSGEMRRVISETPEVRSLDFFEFGVDVKNRTARLRFVARTIYGDVQGEISQQIPGEV